MEQGKISTTILKRSVISYMHAASPVGRDCAAIPVGRTASNAGIDSSEHATGDDKTAIPAASVMVATAVGTGDSLMSAGLAVIKACNNIWAGGGIPYGIETAFLIPESAREIRLKELTQEIIGRCNQCHVKLLGGHTEVTDAVKHIVVTVTAAGVDKATDIAATEDDNTATIVTFENDGVTAAENGHDDIQRSSENEGTTLQNIHRIEPGADIVLTKWMGLEAVALARQSKEEWKPVQDRFTEEYLRETEAYDAWLTIEAEAAIALQSRFGTQYLHDVSDGGVFAALWEMAEGSNRGFEIDLPSLPMRQPVIEVMEVLHRNIYREKSSGSLMIITPCGAELTEELKKNDIPACIVGQITGNRDKILRNGDEVRYLDKA